MSAHIQIPRSQIDSFCRSWQVSELALFGSVLREDFGPDSDVDVLIQFQPQARHTLLDMARIEEELRQIFGRDVDLVERSAVEQSRNHIRREAILQSAESVHGRVAMSNSAFPIRNQFEEHNNVRTDSRYTR